MFGAQYVAPLDKRQYEFSAEEKRAALEHDYSSEDEEGDAGGGGGAGRRRRAQAPGDDPPDEKGPAAPPGFVAQYDLDALAPEEVAALWRQASILTLQPAHAPWFAHFR